MPTLRAWRAVGALARLGATNRIMLSPEGNSFEEMRALATALVSRGRRFLTMTMHSPSVVPGHTPYVRTQADLDRFLETTERFCEFFVGALGGRPITSSATRRLARSQSGA